MAITFGANVILAVLNAATGIGLARLLGPTGRGELQAVQLWGLFLAMFATLGVPEAVVYFVARRRDETGSIAASAMALGLGSSIAFLCAGWFIVPLLLGGQGAEVKRLAQLFLLIIPVFVLGLVPVQALRGLGSFAKWNLMRISPSLLWLVVVLGAWMTGEFSVEVLAFGFVAALAVQLVLNLLMLRSTTAGPFKVEPGRWLPLLRFGVPGVLGSVPQLLNYQLDQLLLVAFVGPDRLGLYVVSVAWAGALAPILAALGSVLFPRLAGEESSAERVRILAKGFRISVIVGLGSVVGLLLLTYPGVMLLFGPQFVDAYPVALVLVVASGTLALGKVLEEGFRGLGRPAEVLWSELSGLGVTVLLLVALLGPLDIMGAAFASLGGYVVTLVVLLARLYHFAGADLKGQMMPRIRDVGFLGRSLAGMVRRGDAPPDLSAD